MSFPPGSGSVTGCGLLQPSQGAVTSAMTTVTVIRQTSVTDLVDRQLSRATIPKTGHAAREMARFLLSGLQPSWRKCHQQTLAQPSVKASPARSQGQN